MNKGTVNLSFLVHLPVHLPVHSQETQIHKSYLVCSA